MSVGKMTDQTSSARHSFAVANKICPPAPFRLQRAGNRFHNRRFACTSHSQVAHADHENAKRALAKNSFAIKIKPHLDEPIVSERKRVEDSPQNRGAYAMTALEHNVDSKLFQIFKPPAHGKW